METAVEQRSVGYAPSQVDPWYSIVHMLYEHLDNDDIDVILHFYQYEDMTTDDDTDVSSSEDEQKMAQRTKFYNALDIYEDKIECAKKIQNIMRDRKMHTENGESFVDIIQRFIDQCEKHHQQLQVKENEVFIGRDADVEKIVEKFTGSPSSVNGVCICGIGGQGKSSLARQVCYKLEEQSQPWKTFIVDLRGTDKTSDVLISMLCRVGEDVGQYDNLKQLQNMMKQFILDASYPTLFCLDDCDAVQTADGYNFVENCLKFFCQLTKENPKLQIRFLFTTRQKFDKRSKAFEQPDRDGFTMEMDGTLAELELKSLDGTDAIELLKRCSQKDDIQDEVAFEIVSACACSPLAITVVSELLHANKYTPQRLLFHLKMDENNVTNALRVDKCIKEAVENLEKEYQDDLVRLSVFQDKPFDLTSAAHVLCKSKIECKNVLQILHNCHLLELEYSKVYRNDTNGERKHTPDHYTLHPLVFRFISEWKKPSKVNKNYYEAVSKFAELYEGVIGKIVKAYDTKCHKGMKMLEQHKTHIHKFYDFLLDATSVLTAYSRKTESSRHVLVKKRVSDLADLLLSDVKKRRLFQSEADRAKKVGNDAMFIFWMVEKADVFLMLHDKAGIAMEILDELTSGRFAALRGLHDQPFYPPLVHALFHKVKGLSRWKQRKFCDAIDHLNLSLRFYGLCSPTSSYASLVARLFSYMGRVHLDMGDLNKAEDAFRQGYEKVVAMMPRLDDKTESKVLQWDVPMYWGYFGKIQLERAKATDDPEQRKKLLDEAYEDLTKGMSLDEELKMDRLDCYCFKRKHRADVYAEKGLLDEALADANEAKDQRREILQPPHINYTESVYQVARMYMLKGNDLKGKGNLEKAKNYWRTSSDYFRELEEHHLINGGISQEHPMFAKIKSDHITIIELTGDATMVKKLLLFYKDVESGKYKSSVASRLESFKKMIWTPLETIKNVFDKGGSAFGEKDAIVQSFEDEAEDQFQNMMQGGTSGRKDSGTGHSSTELEESVSSGSGSISSQVEKMHLQTSMEDNVFGDTLDTVKETENPTENKKPNKKRQKTVDES